MANRRHTKKNNQQAEDHGHSDSYQLGKLEFIERASLRLSVVIVAYNMKRELARTIATLGPEYQKGISATDYEVIVIDNDSRCEYDVEALQRVCPSLLYRRYGKATPSPVPALNYGISLAHGEIICAMIDGARMASPNLLNFGAFACGLHPRAVVGSLSFHIGMEAQNLSVHKGYNQDIEDGLLQAILWTTHGYELFKIASFDPSSKFGLFACPAETNSLFMHRSLWSESGGYDSAFSSRGGGLANLDLWRKLCEDSRNFVVVLIGEGTFHQFHGGTSTNAEVDPWPEFHNEYIHLRRQRYKFPTREPYLFGVMNERFMEFQRRLEQQHEPMPLGAPKVSTAQAGGSEEHLDKRAN